MPLTQSANGAVQEAIWQIPPTQAGVPFGTKQTTPHRPQFCTVVIFVSQRLFWSQSAQPAGQLMPSHSEFMQGLVMHDRPHPPQWFGSVAVLTQVPPQSVPPIEIEQVHRPATQVAPLPLQTVPQAPQLLESVCELDSQPLLMLRSQSAYPALQGPIAQLPRTQRGVPFGIAQITLQTPQLPLSVWRFASQPLVGAPSQLPKPDWQESMAQALCVQVAVAFGRSHRFPQPPQFAASVTRLISHPSTCLLPLQSWNPETQIPAHMPLLHVRTATFSEEQTTPQPPQLFGSTSRLASQPFARSLSQLSNGSAQVIRHVPLRQDGVPFRSEQTAAQAPQ